MRKQKMYQILYDVRNKRDISSYFNLQSSSNFDTKWYTILRETDPSPAKIQQAQ